MPTSATFPISTLLDEWDPTVPSGMAAHEALADPSTANYARAEGTGGGLHELRLGLECPSGVLVTSISLTIRWRVDTPAGNISCRITHDGRWASIAFDETELGAFDGNTEFTFDEETAVLGPFPIDSGDGTGIELSIFVNSAGGTYAVRVYGISGTITWTPFPADVAETSPAHTDAAEVIAAAAGPLIETSPAHTDAAAVDVINTRAELFETAPAMVDSGQIVQATGDLGEVSPAHVESASATVTNYQITTTETSPAHTDAAEVDATPAAAVQETSPTHTEAVVADVEGTDVTETSPAHTEALVCTVVAVIPIDDEDEDMELILGTGAQEILVNMNATGLNLETLTVSVWKPGFVGWGVSLAQCDREVGSGRYALILDATDVDTPGPVSFRVTDGANTGIVSANVKQAEEQDEGGPLSTPIPAGLYR